MGASAAELVRERAAGEGARWASSQMGTGKTIGFAVDSGVTIETRSDGVNVRPGTDGAHVVVSLDADAFADLLAENWSIFGLLYSGRLRVERGTFESFTAWEPALQALLYERPIYDKAAARAAEHLDIGRSFTMADVRDRPTEVSDHLRAAGFLHVRGVFSPAELAPVSVEIERLKSLATPSDGRSWWATDTDGNEVCCRLTYTAQRSAVMAALAGDERLATLAALSGEDLVLNTDRTDGVSCVIKNPNAATGLSDLPWHRDCGMGGHGLLCPGLNIGIQLDPANAANGQLRFLAGSHHHGGPLGDPEELGLPIVAVDADPGDVTVHFGHALHQAPPPSAPDAGRRAVYVGFSKPELMAMVPEGKGYNDVVFDQGDGRVRNVAERAAD